MLTGDDLVAMIEILNLGGCEIRVMVDGVPRSLKGARKGTDGGEQVIELEVS